MWNTQVKHIGRRDVEHASKIHGAEMHRLAAGSDKVCLLEMRAYDAVVDWANERVSGRCRAAIKKERTLTRLQHESCLLGVLIRC